MNERYVYGYSQGWNVENEYINSLNGIMDEYNAQMEKLYGPKDEDQVTSDIPLVDADILRNNGITEEQIRQWYNEDYAQNNSFVTFERYKRDILNSIKKQNEVLNKEVLTKVGPLHKGIERNTDEYFANLYHLIQIKQKTRIEINKRKNELELLLSEKKIQLSSILLEQGRLKPQYDENRRIINSEELQALRKKYDDTWLEIRKIEHALDSLKDMYKLMEFTQEEADLMMRGLNPQQRKIYEEIDKEPKPIGDDEPEKENDEPTPSGDDEPEKEGDERTPSGDNEPEKEDDQPTPVGDDEPEKEEDDITLDGIIRKVCGDEKFNDRQSSRYAASKIKVFSKPQKNNLGNSYKIVSISRKIIGVIPRVAMKVYGLFVSKKTKEIFKEMEERANQLTDKEVEILLNQYKGATAQSKRLPKGFNNAVRPRVNKYVSVRVAKINEQIKNNLMKINYCEKVINALKNKLQEENSPEMVEKMNNLLDGAYSNASNCIKDLISLQIEGNNLQNGNGLHSFEEELKALDTKLNYAGGRFSKSREYDPELWSKISGYSQKIEYSLDPKEVVDSYIAREQVYKENTKEKRSVANLGSKVTTGKLDYRPFVESLDYGNDPFIRDLITSILVVSSAASLVNNIVNNIKQNAMIEEINSKIAQNNKIAQEQQGIINNIRDNGETIEKGVTYDIKQTEGAIENLGERGINDKYDWNLSGKDYIAEDAAHHLDSSNLSLDNTQELLDLSSKYSSGTITYAEYLKGIQSIKEETTGVYESYVNDLSSYIEDYASTHPQFDYTAILSSLKHAASNPADSVELTNFITDLYEKSLNVTDISSLDLIESTMNSATLTPDILTLGAVAAKVSQEEMDSKKQIKPDAKRAEEIRDMIEGLKAMKAELSEDEVKEIEDFLRR